MEADAENSPNVKFLEEENNDTEDVKNIKWSSRIEFIISLLGYSLGLADIWRVPYLVYRNGGGAFLIPYIFFILVCGTPLYFLEIIVSQFSSKGPWAVFDLCPLFRGVGLTCLVMNFFVSIYLTIQKAWTIEYLIDSFSSVLPWSTCGNPWNDENCIVTGAKNEINMTERNSTLNTSDVVMFPAKTGSVSSVEQYWNNKVLHISSGIDDIGDINWKYVLYMVGIEIIIWLSLVRSVKSLGKLMYVTVLIPVAMTIALWIRAMMLPGAATGMMYFITPDFSRLANFEVWIEAGFMAFFTLGPAWGALYVYGCHNKFTDNSYRDSIATSITTILYGLLNGLVAFSVIGVMAEESGIDISKVITSGGFSLGFVAYPKALTYFPLPQLWAVMVFLTLLLPSIDTQCIVLEPILCTLEDMFPKMMSKRRVHLLTAVIVISPVLALPFASQAGVYMFQLMDWYTATFSLLFVALVESVMFAWAYGGDRISRDLRMMLGCRLPPFVRISCAFIIPIFLLMLVFVSFFTYRPPNYGTYYYPDYANVIGWCVAMTSLLPMFLWVIWSIYTSEGPILERFSALVKPSPLWGPCVKELRSSYYHSETSSDRSLKKLFKFNLLGNNEMYLKAEEQELNSDSSF